MSAGGAEAAAPYISKWLYNKEKGSDLTAEEKETVSAITSLLGTATGAVIGDTTANAAQGSLNAQSAVENNWLYSQTAKQKGWLSKTEIELLDRLAQQSGARSIEYFIQEEQKIHQSDRSVADKEKALANLKREYEADSQKMEATAAKLPKGSKERGMLYDITSKMQGIVSVIAPYKESEIIRAEQRDWLPTSSPFYDGNSGFVAVQQQWAINDGKTPEEARFQTEMPAAGRGGGLKSTSSPKTSHSLKDIENLARVKHNSKLKTTFDGKLSVTHGLSYDAKKELDEIRAFLVENKKEKSPFINNHGSHRGDPNKISIATATVTTKDGTTTHLLAVSGKSWSGNAPDKVTINGKEYQVIRDEVKTIKVINGKNEGVKILPDQSNPKNNQDNGNHAEKKLMSHITQQNQNGSINDVKINIQNTSKESPGACFGCGGKDGTGGTIQDFKNLNKDLKIHIEHDSTKTSP